MKLPIEREVALSMSRVTSRAWTWWLVLPALVLVFSGCIHNNDTTNENTTNATNDNTNTTVLPTQSTPAINQALGFDLPGDALVVSSIDNRPGRYAVVFFTQLSMQETQQWAMDGLTSVGFIEATGRDNWKPVGGDPNGGRNALYVQQDGTQTQVTLSRDNDRTAVNIIMLNVQ